MSHAAEKFDTGQRLTSVARSDAGMLDHNAKWRTRMSAWSSGFPWRTYKQVLSAHLAQSLLLPRPLQKKEFFLTVDGMLMLGS